MKKIVMITGATSGIGEGCARKFAQGGYNLILTGRNAEKLQVLSDELKKDGAEVLTLQFDVRDAEAAKNAVCGMPEEWQKVDVLINNAANNPKVEGGSKNLGAMRFHNFPVEIWDQDLAVGLTGAMLCAQVFGEVMEKQQSGVILNISSDYGLIAPDQRIYRKEGLPEDQQTIKPVSYSVVKHGLIGLTKYLAIYWAEKGIRVNTLCPASLENGQDPDFVEKISKRIPMARMSRPDEYVCTILYMISDAATYMTGATVVLDGGRTSW